MPKIVDVIEEPGPQALRNLSAYGQHRRAVAPRYLHGSRITDFGEPGRPTSVNIMASAVALVFEPAWRVGSVHSTVKKPRICRRYLMIGTGSAAAGWQTRCGDRLGLAKRIHIFACIGVNKRIQSAGGTRRPICTCGATREWNDRIAVFNNPYRLLSIGRLIASIRL